MSKIHLSEEQLQRYVLDGFTDPAAVEHVAHCAHCQLQINAYQMLYSHIREAEAPLLDAQTERFILDQLPDVKMEERRETRYLYSLLFGAIGVLVAVLAGCWRTISWVFSDIATGGLALGLLLLLFISAMQLKELYNTYQKRIRALQSDGGIKI